MKKIWHCLVFVLMVLVIFQSGCAPKSTPLTNTPAPVIASPTTPPDVPVVLPNAISKNILLDPAVATDADSNKINVYVYDSLTRLDSNSKPVAALALKWTVSDDQLDYVIVLRQDVAFHSGAPFNADTVLANFNRWFDPADPLHGTSTYLAWKKYFLGFKGDLAPDKTPVSMFDGIEKVDQHTVLVHLNRPMPDLLLALADPGFSILNPDMLSKNGEKTGTSAETVDGTGAYFVTKWSDSGLVLSPNSTYWGGAPLGELQFPWK